MDIQNRLRELLLPVFGLESINEIKPEYSLINDLGADSLDFVEIIHIIETQFGVVVKANEIMVGGSGIYPDDIFVDGRLTDVGVSLLSENYHGREDSFRPGMTKVEVFSLLTVKDLADIIKSKMHGG
jgi:acyl carrier protein